MIWAERTQDSNLEYHSARGGFVVNVPKPVVNDDGTISEPIEGPKIQRKDDYEPIEYDKHGIAMSATWAGGGLIQMITGRWFKSQSKV